MAKESLKLNIPTIAFALSRMERKKVSLKKHATNNGKEINVKQGDIFIIICRLK